MSFLELQNVTLFSYLKIGSLLVLLVKLWGGGSTGGNMRVGLAFTPVRLVSL